MNVQNEWQSMKYSTKIG